MNGRKRVVLFLLVLATGAASLLVLQHGDSLAGALEWAKANPGYSSLAFALLYVLGAVMMTPSWIFTVAAGYLFGWVAGVALVSVASLAGALAAFVLARFLVRDWVADRARRMPRFDALDRAVAQNGFMVVLLVRLSLVFPYNLMNYLLGATSVGLRPYALATWLGMVPAALIYVFLGSTLGNATALLGGELDAGPMGRVLAVGGLLALLALVWYLARLANRILAGELATLQPGEPAAQSTSSR